MGGHKKNATLTQMCGWESLDLISKGPVSCSGVTHPQLEATMLPGQAARGVLRTAWPQGSLGGPELPKQDVSGVALPRTPGCLPP